MGINGMGSVTTAWADSYLQFLTGSSSTTTIMDGATGGTELEEASQGTTLSGSGQQAAVAELKQLNSTRLLDIMA